MSDMKCNILSLLETMVATRYKTLEDIKHDIEVLTDKKVETIIESESERFEHQDFMIDFTFENDSDVYTIFYLVDNANHYYITEV